MGSDSDWPVMKAAGEALTEFDVAYEADVVSAHRMPEEMLAYGSEAAGRGLSVIIAGAGGAAHLPGMLAAVTPLPVIGVPVPLKYLDGMDSLLSIVQMPAGRPGRDRGGRQRPQRRPARRPHPRRRPTRRCSSGWSTSRPSSAPPPRRRARPSGASESAPARLLESTSPRPAQRLGARHAGFLRVAAAGVAATPRGLRRPAAAGEAGRGPSRTRSAEPLAGRDAVAVLGTVLGGGRR